MRVAVLFSGGKDSCYTVWLLQHQGWNVARLVTVKPVAEDSMIFHHPNVEWTGLQAQAMDIPHSLIEGGDELRELRETLDALKRKERIVGVATGAVSSDFQKSTFDRVCDSVALRSFSPLWHKDPRTIVEDLIKMEFRVIISGVGASGLDQSWLGRDMTAPWWGRLAKLSALHGINLSGEGGEYETFVVDAPDFKKRIIVEESRSVWEGQSGHFDIKKASFREKLAN